MISQSNTARFQGFTVQPVSVIQAEGLKAVFECLYPGATAYSWGLDRIYPPADAFPPDLTRTLPSGNTPARLSIPSTGQYNSTMVQCRAVLDVGGDAQFVQTCDALLLVQGILIGMITSFYILCFEHFRSTGFCYWTETRHGDLYFSDSHMGCPLLSRPHHS